MENEHNIDPLDEAIRLVHLDQLRTMEVGQLQEEWRRVSEGNRGSVSQAQEQILMDRLKAVLLQPSFGELIRAAMQERQLSDTTLSERTGVSVQSIGALSNDEVYPNNVPIQGLKKLVTELHLAYQVVKAAAFKTFQQLQQQAALKDLSGYSPAYRKGEPGLRTARPGADVDGKELFENEEALNKYLNRLEELMND